MVQTVFFIYTCRGSGPVSCSTIS